MIRICAWCGVVTAMAPPLDDRTRTHGICARCADRILRGLDQPPPSPLPPCHWLIVVRWPARELYWRLRAGLEDLRGVSVILDRRRAERRRGAPTLEGDRRREPRRRTLSQHEREVWHALGLRVVHHS